MFVVVPHREDTRGIGAAIVRTLEPISAMKNQLIPTVTEVAPLLPAHAAPIHPQVPWGLLAAPNCPTAWQLRPLIRNDSISLNSRRSHLCCI